MSLPTHRQTLLLLAACAALAGCVQHLDPTQIFSPPPPLAHGVNLTVYRSGDPNNTPVVNVWVDNAADTVNIKTLLTTAGGAQYSCVASNFCPCEGPVAALTPGVTGYGYWTLFCKTNGDVTPPTDANSSATQSYPFDLPLYFGWDWTDHNNAVVPDGTYIIHAEVSGYYYGGNPGEASITVTKNGAAGSTSGQADGAQWKAIFADWKP